MAFPSILVCACVCGVYVYVYQQDCRVFQAECLHALDIVLLILNLNTLLHPGLP